MGLQVLIIQYSANLDGSAISGLMLANALRESGWHTTVAFAFEGPVIEKYLTAGHDIRIVPHRSWFRTSDRIRFIRNFGKEVQAARSLVKVVDELKPDLVYVNTVVSLAGALAARWRKIPCIWHLRELFADVGGEMKAPGTFRPFVRWVIRSLADHIITNSRAVAFNILGGEPDGLVTVVPNAVGEEFFDNPITKEEARKKFDLPLHVPVIGIPGTLRPMKGHPFFFRASQRIIEKYPNLVVAITGDGEEEYKRELYELIDQTHMSSSVRFLGSIRAMPEFYRACDVVCIPSVAEPFGRTVIEAMASGTPVVASEVGGIAEIIDNGSTGILVRYSDENTLSTALTSLFENSVQSKQLAKTALCVAKARYSRSVSARNVMQLINDIVP